VQSTTEKVALVLTGVSVFAVTAWWWVYDFTYAGFSAYLPFLIPPILAAIYWFVRERRLEAQVSLWESVMNPFPNRDFPDGILDPKRHGVGWMEVNEGVKLGAVLSLPSEDGIHLQMSMNAGRFRDKLIPWEEIARLTYLKAGKLSEFGTTSLGFVAIQFTTPRNLKMVIPWRETFVAHVPERLGFQEVHRAGKTSK
jgi:hypothetical protein